MTSYRKESYAFVANMLQLDKHAPIADIGSGDSWREYLGRYDNVTTVDDRQYGEIKVLADITRPLPLKDQSYEAVVLMNVFEHTPEPRLLAQEAHRILKKGGTLIGAVPFLYPPHQEPRDFFRYTPYELEILFKDFKNVDIQPLATAKATIKQLENVFWSANCTPSIKNRLGWFLVRAGRKFLSSPVRTTKFCLGYSFIAKK